MKSIFKYKNVKYEIIQGYFSNDYYVRGTHRMLSTEDCEKEFDFSYILNVGDVISIEEIDINKRAIISKICHKDYVIYELQSQSDCVCVRDKKDNIIIKEFK